MTGKLEGKAAIVTGGGGGVGRGTALALADEGADVVVCGRTEATLVAVCDEIAGRGRRGVPVVCDVMDLDQLEHLVTRSVAELGTVDILVNNAMVVPHGLLLEIDEATVDDGWRSSPLATFRLMRLCHPYLTGGGAIVNVSSGASMAGEVPLRGMYAAVKAALNALSRAAAVEWGPDGIRVNTVMPFALTDALEQWVAREPASAEATIARVPLRRIGDPENDIGRVIAFLAGPDANYLTGALIPLDGGISYVR